MVERGLQPLLAARSRPKLDELAAELGGLETADGRRVRPAEVARAGRAAATCSSRRWARSCAGAHAAAAAATTPAHTTSTRPASRPSSVRSSSATDRAAEKTGIAMFTALGYDWVPGNLAGGLALDRAGDAVDAGRRRLLHHRQRRHRSMSGGTKASLVGVIAAPSFRFVDGRVQTERGAQALRTFPVAARSCRPISVGSSEHFALPRLAPGLREVNAYLGWFGPASRAMQVMSGGMSLAMKMPGVSSSGRRRASGSSRAPPAAPTRARGPSLDRTSWRSPTTRPPTP